MKTWVVAILLVLVGGLFFEFHRLHNVEEANQKKLQEEAIRIEQLSHNLQKDIALLTKTLAEEEQHKQARAKMIQDKRYQLTELQKQLSQLNDHPDLNQRRALAAAYLKKEKDKVAAIESQIKSLLDQKSGNGGAVKSAEQNLDYTYHQQDAQLSERIKLEEQTLSQLNAQLSQIKVDKRNPQTQEDYNTQKQAVEIQKKVVTNFRQQRTELAQQHTLARDNINVTNGQNNSELDASIATLRQDLASEKKYYDEADRANRAVNSTVDANSSQVKDLQVKIQALTNEIHDLELTK